MPYLLIVSILLMVVPPLLKRWRPPQQVQVAPQPGAPRVPPAPAAGVPAQPAQPQVVQPPQQLRPRWTWHNRVQLVGLALFIVFVMLFLHNPQSLLGGEARRRDDRVRPISDLEWETTRRSATVVFDTTVILSTKNDPWFLGKPGSPELAVTHRFAKGNIVEVREVTWSKLSIWGDERVPAVNAGGIPGSAFDDEINREALILPPANIGALVGVFGDRPKFREVNGSLVAGVEGNPSPFAIGMRGVFRPHRDGHLFLAPNTIWDPAFQQGYRYGSWYIRITEYTI